MNIDSRTGTMARRGMRRSLWAAIALAAATVEAGAGTIYVDAANCPGPGSGTIGDPYCSIQSGIAAAATGIDEVEVAPGTYNEVINFFGKAITVRSADGAAATTIDGGGALHVVACVNGEGPASVLDGFTVTGGEADGSYPNSNGGGMYIAGASSPTVRNCVFAGNTATDIGGGLYVAADSSVSLTGCAFDANAANGGGAAFIFGTATFTATAFVGNTANYDGGAINGQGPLAGGVADVTLVNCLFRGNIGQASTGAAVTNLLGGTMNVINCTFADNSGTTAGGLASVDSTTTVANCIFWDDTPMPVAHFGGGTTTVTYSNVQGGYAGTGNLDLDPLFVDQTGGDLRLDTCSPAADFGLNGAVPAGVTTDLDGNPRFANDAGVVDSAPGLSPLVDRGAYERQIDSPAGSCCGTPVFLAAYGLENFSQHYIDALDTFLCAQQLYDAADYAGAQAVLDALWAEHPAGGDDWGYLPWFPFNINLGTPASYYGLRMLSDMTSWRVANPDAPPAPRTVRLTVLIVGQSSGIEPQNVQDIENGTGVFVVHEVDPRVSANDYAAVHESLKLFNEYAFAAVTQGQLDVETHILPLPDLDLPVVASVTPSGTYFAGLDYGADLHGMIFSAMPQEEIEATDWWWLLYPSHVPEQYPDFEGVGFLTGGMGTGADAVSPMFIIDDRWIVRKPAPLGDGEYSPLERSVYLPQWLQHEFYHHLYRTWPEFGLEDEGHQWFDLDTWPEDFEGQYEPDYYHESLYKRLHFAEPAPHAALRYATADAPWDELTNDDVLGEYRREPVENPWHIGTIQLDDPQLEWLNTAGVSWDLLEDFLEGRLLTGPDCPYFNDPNGQSFDLILARDEIGDLTTDVAAFTFLGEVYERQPAPCPWDLDGEGSTGVPDLLALLAAWGADPGGPPDFDGDGIVGVIDLLELLAGWGPCP